MEISKLKQLAAQYGYELLAPIGSGGCGSVYLVKSLKYQEQFCLKIIPFVDTELSALSRAKAAGEVDSLRMLNHQNIIKMYESFSDDNNFYIILEFCPGGSLKDLTKIKRHLKGRSLYEVTRQVCNAIEFCHQHKIAHRDIKPSNILIDKYGRCKLADFGLSSRNDNNSFEFVGGSPLFMSPESFLKGSCDAFKSDMWALGVTLYYLGTGSLPFYSNNLDDLKKMIKVGLEHYPPRVEKNFAKLILGLLNPNKDERWTISNVLSSEYFAAYMNNEQTHGLPQPLVRRSTDFKINSTLLLQRRTTMPNTAIHVAENGENGESGDTSPCQQPPIAMKMMLIRRGTIGMGGKEKMPRGLCKAANMKGPTFFSS